ncbi:DNA gyrase, A subunit [Thermanaerovibrio acidaminovorans DSM 6589]|uniref:DNA gyrase subunit A n=1 Tax=Thermanaerovibrio acidaminovorans (strain ATCC 49978 / DSM 6589 / Su883) TaxID=525903 RepID=D1B8A6_THEAS|nr:DNA gyrase subunit A [Thermanaerovibrio acidaminovorans]ACZ18509.1 DNA gyrase, A subunit [Thermanaerovibrio acidaminovorans DSM 6589]
MEKGNGSSDLFQKVIPLPLEEEIKHSYIDYAMSVIVGRALPDARDGLKPVQRRILYAMRELGLRHSQPFKKSARVVGETMGKYHPHGDAAIYETMVRMSQDFSMRYPLVDGQGNFGSIDGDPPAAMRYTEARLHSLGEEMLADIDEDTVDWLPNFDESLEEPAVLPSRIPNLLVNGSTGIAVGMATNMPPHNLREVVDACCTLLDNPDVEVGELMTHVPGPDFPTGGVIMGRDGIIDAYTTGRGKIVVRGCAEIEDAKRGKKAIVITQIPYMVNKSNLIETIVKGVQAGQLDGITDVRDESNREGIRLVLELHRDSDPHLVLRQLYSRTQLQTTFGVINLALVDGRPVELNLKGLLQIFIDHRRMVVRRRTQYRLRKAEERAHILEGLVKALDMIDMVIALIRSSEDPLVAKGRLVEELGFTEAQAQAILDMRLQRLTSLEKHKLQEELAELMAQIARYRLILGDPAELDSVVREELLEVKRAYGDERRTVIEDSVDDVSYEDLIPETEVVVAMTRDGFIRRMPLQDYRCQARGGKGVKGAAVKGEDEVSLVAVTTTHRSLYLFTDRGRVFSLKCLAIPEPKSGRGKHVSTFISLDEGESVVTFRDSALEGARFVFLVTKMGLAKRLPVGELEGITRAGRRILGLEEDDTIARVRFTGGEDQLLLTTAKGQTLRVSETEFRPQGRAAKGVRGIKLDPDDLVVGCDVIMPGRQVLFISQLGMGKRTRYEEFTVHHRGGMGVRAMRLGERTGHLVGAWGVADDDEIMVITSRGRVVRFSARDVSSLSRSAMGLTLVRLDEGDQVADVTVIRCSMEEGE